MTCILILLGGTYVEPGVWGIRSTIKMYKDGVDIKHEYFKTIRDIMLAGF